jgi:hypothetical protein
LIVIFDCRSLEHESNRAVGQINTYRHFGDALIGAVAHAEPATNFVDGIKTVDVHAFVEVRFGTEFVHVFVGRIKSYAHEPTVAV